MKRIILCLGVLSFVASAAMAGNSLIAVPPLEGQTASAGKCITPDGVYVGGTCSGLFEYGNLIDASTAGFLWDAVNGTRLPMSFGSSYPHNWPEFADGIPQLTLSGIAYRSPTGGALPQLVIHGLVPDKKRPERPVWYRHSMNYSTDGGMTWTAHVRVSGSKGWPDPKKGVWINGQNTMAGSGDSVYAACFFPIEYDRRRPKLYVDQMYGGDPASYSLGESKWKEMPERKEKRINGVSAAGLGVGWTRGQHTGVKENLLLVHQTGQRWLNHRSFVALYPVTYFGEAQDISDNSAVVVGNSPVIDREGQYPYMYDVGSDVATELATLPDMTGIAYGVDADGTWAAGISTSEAQTKATVWDLSDPNSVIDLTQYFADRGMLDEWDYLYRAFAVVVKDNGDVMVTGEGVRAEDESVQAFVVTMCTEPTVLEMDILPEDDPNLFTPNKKGRGRLPIEIYGTETFDVASIDLSSIKVAGAVSPVKSSTDIDYNGDGYLDLKIHIARRALIDALSLDTRIGEIVVIEVEADTLDKCEVLASDVVEIIPLD